MGRQLFYGTKLVSFFVFFLFFKFVMCSSATKWLKQKVFLVLQPLFVFHAQKVPCDINILPKRVNVCAVQIDKIRS